MGRKTRASAKDELSELMEDQRRSSWYRDIDCCASTREERDSKENQSSETDEEASSGSEGSQVGSQSKSRGSRAKKETKIAQKKKRALSKKSRKTRKSAQKRQSKKSSREQVLDELKELEADQKGKWFTGASEESDGTDKWENSSDAAPHRKMRKILCDQEDEEAIGDSSNVGGTKLVTPEKSARSLKKKSVTRKKTRRIILESEEEDVKDVDIEEAKAEVEELNKDQEFQNRSTEKWDDKSETEEESSTAESGPFVPPVPPLCKNCSKLMDQQEAGNERSYGKIYFTCWQCKTFLWADDRNVEMQMPCGPVCNCRPTHPSHAIRDLSTGRCLWVCSNTNNQPCDFEKEIDLENDIDVSNPVVGFVASQSSNDKQFLVGGETLSKLQGLFHLKHDDGPLLRSNHQVKTPKGYYDYMKVEYAWKLDAPAQSTKEFNAFRDKVPCNGQPISLRPSYNDACEKFIACEAVVNNLEPLRKEANEVLLIHGTKPSVVANILEQSLDPKMARAGLYGSGTYFAEHPAKINQYVVRDEEWKGGRRKRRHGSICSLHNKLFPRADMHPGNVFYALVCRVVMGDPFVTSEEHDPRGPTDVSAFLQNPKIAPESSLFLTRGQSKWNTLLPTNGPNITVPVVTH